MKKILNVLLLTLITSQLSYSQRIVQNDLYTVVYSESYQQPLTLTYQYPIKTYDLNFVTHKITYVNSTIFGVHASSPFNPPKADPAITGVLSPS